MAYQIKQIMKTLLKEIQDAIFEIALDIDPVDKHRRDVEFIVRGMRIDAEIVIDPDYTDEYDDLIYDIRIESLAMIVDAGTSDEMRFELEYSAAHSFIRRVEIDNSGVDSGRDRI